MSADMIDQNEPREPAFPHDDPEATDIENVPAGRAGADSGAADAVRIDPEDEASLPDASSQNDIPGVGPRPGSGHR